MNLVLDTSQYSLGGPWTAMFEAIRSTSINSPTVLRLPRNDVSANSSAVTGVRESLMFKGLLADETREEAQPGDFRPSHGAKKSSKAEVSIGTATQEGQCLIGHFWQTIHLANYMYIWQLWG